MIIKKILYQLNVVERCKRYGVSLWQCPQFLMLVMGFVIGTTSILSFAIGTRYITEPEVVALIVLFIAAVLMVVSFLIIKSFERLAETNRMKSEFVSIVSHQLRSPLQNLKWSLELLMSGRLGEIKKKQLDYFKILKDNISRMDELASDLLIVSRIETAALPIVKRGFSLASLTEKLIDEFRPFSQASNVKIVFSPQAGLPDALGDPNQIGHVLENLIDNAIRYTGDRGEVRIRIEKRGERIYLEAKDEGVGIPEEDQRHIFQKFFRSSNVSKYQTRGSGLGLFIAKSIVERSGGKMGFKSKEGEGSVFWFNLPTKK